MRDIAGRNESGTAVVELHEVDAKIEILDVEVAGVKLRLSSVVASCVW